MSFRNDFFNHLHTRFTARWVRNYVAYRAALQRLVEMRCTGWSSRLPFTLLGPWLGSTTQEVACNLSPAPPFILSKHVNGASSKLQSSLQPHLVAKGSGSNSSLPLGSLWWSPAIPGVPWLGAESFSGGQHSFAWASLCLYTTFLSEYQAMDLGPTLPQYELILTYWTASTETLCLKQVTFWGSKGMCVLGRHCWT